MAAKEASWQTSEETSYAPLQVRPIRLHGPDQGELASFFVITLLLLPHLENCWGVLRLILFKQVGYGVSREEHRRILRFCAEYNQESPCR